MSDLVPCYCMGVYGCVYWNTGLSIEAFKTNLQARIAKKQPHT
jgi:hypothetical protein